jgi:hypothetical protein
MALAHAIVGRDSELHQLRAVLDARDPPYVVFVEGDAGVIGRVA